jgi:hypothetical protein
MQTKSWNHTTCFRYNLICNTKWSRDSSVRIALGYRLEDRGSRVRFPAGAGNFLHHRVQNGSRAHPVSYPTDSFPGVKRPGREADQSSPSSAKVKEWVELYLHSNTPLWCDAQLKKKHRDNYLSFCNTNCERSGNANFTRVKIHNSKKGSERFLHFSIHFSIFISVLL